ncbi:hypothetical protein HDU87_000706 [Geranomyces variabilis]|uniref:Gamma-butyrobetaine dioxygenase n=1 Tax=Geranomyces variabilis TaxID=109894 RepID=A0AAD5XU51_9FUNG|nr:hypothetical protein HDU87_000706 [Geranomyces variabilis]
MWMLRRGRLARQHLTPRDQLSKPRLLHATARAPNKLTRASDRVSIEWTATTTQSAASASAPSSSFHHIWLRDNCQCPQCVHPSNRQKLHSSADVSTASLLKAETAELVNNGKQLQIRWAPGSLLRLGHRRPNDDNDDNAGHHETLFDLTWLRANDPALAARRRDALLKPLLWTADDFTRSKQDVQYDDFMSESGQGLRTALRQLRDYGLAFIRNAPTTRDTEVERIAERFGCIRHTFYGPSWNVKSMPDAKNIAYTSLDLGLHMDLMYFEAPPGLQLLHSLKNSVTGGASIFLDSFKAASILKATNPEAYRALLEIPVTFHYINDGRHMHFRRPTIVENDANEPLMVYYAPPFQGPLECSPDDVARFYPAFQAFADIMRDPALTYKMMMRPGDCMVFANRRVLHGREEFDAASGERHLKGAYVDWDDFKDRLRVVGTE